MKTENICHQELRLFYNRNFKSFSFSLKPINDLQAIWCFYAFQYNHGQDDVFFGCAYDIQVIFEDFNFLRDLFLDVSSVLKGLQIDYGSQLFSQQILEALDGPFSQSMLEVKLKIQLIIMIFHGGNCQNLGFLSQVPYERNKICFTKLKMFHKSYFMDYKQKLKNRLNIKFEPIPGHRYSIKKLHEQNQPKNKEQVQLDKNRSNSQVKLPSLSLQKRLRLVSERSEASINLAELRNKAKSIKNPPKIIAESRAPIHQTITYLIQNQILSIPKIVGLLQKSSSQEFLYMRVVGIYEYEVCTEDQKGPAYVTVSSNGMVADGELIPLEKLVHDFEVYNKLKKIHFFKYFSLVKFMNKWNRGSKRAQFIENRKKLAKILNLQDSKILQWKAQLTAQLQFVQKGGWYTDNWAKNLADKVSQMKQTIHLRLTEIIHSMLQKFDLPISNSTVLMNKVLGNLGALSMTFEKKIRIERQLQTFYRIARHLEFYWFHSIGSFILSHLDNLCDRIEDSVNNYRENILISLEKLTIQKEEYGNLRDTILQNSPVSFQIDFKVIIDGQSNVRIEPNSQDLYFRFTNQVKQFINYIQSLNLALVRTSEFDFVVNNVVKGVTKDYDEKNITVKDYVLSLPDYNFLLDDLLDELKQLQIVVDRRLALLDPFIKLYRKFKNKKPQNITCSYEDIKVQCERIDQALEFCTKIHEGQFFLFGYLSQIQFRNQIKQQISRYREQFLEKVPIIMKQKKNKLRNDLVQHLQKMGEFISSPAMFIKISTEAQLLQELVLQWSLLIHELDQIQQFYAGATKISLVGLSEIKNLIQSVKSKLKVFKETRENNFLLYRRQLEVSAQTMTEKVEVLHVRNQSFYNISEDVSFIHKNIQQSLNQLNLISEQLKRLNQLQNFFVVKTTHIPKLQMLIVEYEILEQIWKVYSFWQTQKSLLPKQFVMTVNYKQLMKQFELGLRKLQKHVKDIQYSEVCKFLIPKVQEFLSCLEVTEDFQASHLRSKDYTEIQLLIEKQTNWSTKIAHITIEGIFNYRIIDLKSQINQITFKAIKQIEIQRMLQSYRVWWKNMKLQSKQLDDYPLIVIFGENQKIRKQIQTNTTLLVNILNHKYGGFVRKQCHGFLRQINNLTTLLQLTVAHQEKFLELFPILTSKYGEKQFGNEFKKFNQILTKTMKNVRVMIKPTQNLNDTTRTLLNTHIKQFDSISKVLAEFLQRKRVKFQRFYFLQDDQMLQVLVGIAGQSNIFRMFDGIKGWLLNSENIKIGIQGVGGQQLVLKGWSYKTQEPQIVFKHLQQSIKTTLNSIVRHILFGYEHQMKQLKNLYKGVPWMCIYTVQMILFTKQIQLNCFQEGLSLTAQLNLIQQSILNASSTPIDNSNYITMMLFLHHFTQQLLHKEVNSVFRFEWNSFLRYYHQSQTVTMRALGSEHIWGGQYQGFWNLMINTSDIRRAHACVLGNLKYGNGVLLQGPAGTGKTQSLKQLARCMAKYCVLFNCSNQINIKTLQKLLSGLCYTGSWLCLDEINRLSTEVMSVVANQITTIKNAIGMGKQVFNFLGKDIKLRQGVGIFATMNPIYLRRAKLTENLKEYFRVISVNIPDYQKILQVLLHGLNFTQASQLSKKISKMFKNLSIQLDDYPQYDFGLRAMKFFIFNVHSLRKKAKTEEEAIIDGFIQSFYPRLDPSDANTFEKVITDTFGRKTVFSHQRPLTDKLHSMINTPQTGIIVLGPTSTKTTLINQYIKKLGKTVSIHRCNPISMELRHLMGENILGRWHQGIIQKVVRESLSMTQETHIMVLDGRIKSQTIQNFNTLLDDSKILSLPSGTRLKVHNNFKILMETPDLTQTSPATITRCNIIYVSTNDISINIIIEKLLPTQIPLDCAKKIKSILKCLTLPTIFAVAAIYPLFMFREYQTLQWTEANCFGFEKIIIYTIQLLGYQQNIRKFILKDNSVNQKRSPYNYAISFDKYVEGEFVQLPSEYKVQNFNYNFIITTPQMKFYQWVIEKAVSRRINLLWLGPKNSGKSTAITYTLSKFPYLSLPLTTFLTSNHIIQCLDIKLDFKKQAQTLSKDHTIIFVDNIGMATESTSEMLRMMVQYKQLFYPKISTMANISHFTIIAQHNEKIPISPRLIRHFAVLKPPQPDENSSRSFFSHFLKTVIQLTKTQAIFKTAIEVQIDRLSIFLIDYIKKAKTIKNVVIYPLQLVECIKGMSKLSDKNTKQTGDFILYFFNELRTRQVELKSQNCFDMLKLAYTDVFRGKFHQQYDNSFKNRSFFTSVISGYIEKIKHWDNFKAKLTKDLEGHFYFSDFVMNQVLEVMRVLDCNEHFCLIGPVAIGKKTIFKIASRIIQIDTHSLPSVQTQKQIASWLFNVIKRTFEKKKIETIIIQLNQNAEKLLEVYEKIISGYPSSLIFGPQQMDYAYMSIQDFFEGSYNKNQKTYDQVLRDYIIVSQSRVRLLMSSTVQNSRLLQQYYYTNKRTAKKFVLDYPSDSIIEISQRILQGKMQDKSNVKKIVSVGVKNYYQILGMVLDNEKQGNFHLKYNQLMFFQFIENYCVIHSQLMAQYRQAQDILNRSILKISDTSQVLQKIKNQLLETEPQIKSKSQKMAQFVPILQAKKKASEQVKYIVESQQLQLELKRKQIRILMKQVNDKIAKSQPLLNEANDSINSIKRSQLSEIKNNTNPHPLIKFTLQNLVILLGQSQNWQNIKKVVSDPNLMMRIKNCSPLQPDYLKVKKRIQESEDWSVENVAKIAVGSKYICKWIIGLVKFCEIKSSIDQQKKIVEGLKKELEGSEQKAKIKQNQFNQNNYALKLIQDQYNQNMKQSNRLQELLVVNQKRFKNALKIQTGLSESLIKWKSKLHSIKQSKNYLDAHVMLFSYFLHVHSPLKFQEKQRINHIISNNLQKIGLPFDSNFDVLQQIKQYIIPLEKTAKLTSQQLTNPKLIQLLYHWNAKPLILDPDHQATGWLEKNYSNNITITREVFAGSTKSVQTAIKEGHLLILLVQNQLDNFSAQLVHSKIIHSSNRSLIEYNKNQLTLHPDFKVILCNKSRNPNISINLSIKHPIINFEVTGKLLKNHLLVELLKFEDQNMYSTKIRLQKEKRQNQEYLKMLEDKIINNLISSKKSLVDDQQFLQNLKESQKKTEDLKNSSELLATTFQTVQKYLKGYDNVCERASFIYSSLKRVSKLSNLLNWSIQIFIQYFLRATLESISTMTYSINTPIYNQVVNNYEFDHYSISMQNSRPTSALSYISAVTSKQQQQQRKDDFDEDQTVLMNNFQNLLGFPQMYIDEGKKGTMSNDRENEIISLLVSSLKHAFNSEQRMTWALVLCLMEEKPQDIKMLVQNRKRKTLKEHIQIGQVTDSIKKYFSKVNDEYELQVTRILTDMNPFKNYLQFFSKTDILLLCKLVRPYDFIDLCHKMIRSEGYGSILDYEEAKVVDWFQKSDNQHPILLVMGQDPVQRLTDYLGSKKYRNVILIPMGQGQNKLAEAVLDKESKKENLVILHNLHISQAFYPFLSKTIQQFQIRPPHKNFRLILISNLNQTLPSTITATCHKYLIQQPQGLSNRIKYLYEHVPVHLAFPTHRTLAYSISLFHSLLNEINKFKPLGWVLTNNFNTSDFAYALKVFKEIVESSLDIKRYQCNIDQEDLQNIVNHDEIDFESLKYLIGEVSYVGKLADEIDRDKMRVYINKFFHPNVLNPKHSIMGIKCLHVPQTGNQEDINTAIDLIEEQPSVFGLDASLKPLSETAEYLLKGLSQTYFLIQSVNNINQINEKSIDPIGHKFDFVNREIIKFNENPGQNGKYLRELTGTSKIFNLRAFKNPRQFFTEIKKEAANKNNVEYDKVQLAWTFIGKDNTYGIKNLKLEGGIIKNGNLTEGLEDYDITIYVQAVLKKKQRQTKKNMVSIPFYLNSEREGRINSYGDNINLLTKVHLQSSEAQEFWTLRGTAFIVI